MNHHHLIPAVLGRSMNPRHSVRTASSVRPENPRCNLKFPRFTKMLDTYASRKLPTPALCLFWKFRNTHAHMYGSCASATGLLVVCKWRSRTQGFGSIFLIWTTTAWICCFLQASILCLLAHAGRWHEFGKHVCAAHTLLTANSAQHYTLERYRSMSV